MFVYGYMGKKIGRRRGQIFFKTCKKINPTNNQQLVKSAPVVKGTEASLFCGCFCYFFGVDKWTDMRFQNVLRVSLSIAMFVSGILASTPNNLQQFFAYKQCKTVTRFQESNTRNETTTRSKQRWRTLFRPEPQN